MTSCYIMLDSTIIFSSKPFPIWWSRQNWTKTDNPAQIKDQLTASRGTDSEEPCPQISGWFAILSFNSLRLDWRTRSGSTVLLHSLPLQKMRMSAGEGVLTRGGEHAVRLMCCPGSFLCYAQVRPVFCFPATAAIYSPGSVCHSACDPCGQLKAYV